MINKEAKIVVAVSGGVDSVYMLHMLVEQGYTNLGVVHLNHRARKNSDMEEQFVKGLAGENGLVFHTMSANVKQMAKTGNESFELAARKFRRMFFEEVMEEHDYEWLALGQHADDQAETVLFNFLRGSGVHGLAGMLAKDKRQKIFRPLLNMTKDEIYNCAIAAMLDWHEDHTNQETDYDRNWLRNNIIPQLEKRRSGVKKVLCDTATRMQDMGDYINEHAGEWFNGYFIADNESITVHYFMSQHKVLRAEVLGLIWEHYHGSREHYKSSLVFEVEKWLSSNPDGGSRLFFGDYRMVFKKNIVTFVKF